MVAYVAIATRPQRRVAISKPVIHILRDDDASRTYCSARLTVQARPIEGEDIARHRLCEMCRAQRNLWQRRAERMARR